MKGCQACSVKNPFNIEFPYGGSISWSSYVSFDSRD